MSELLLVRFVTEIGRMRDVSGLAAVTQKELNEVIGTEFDFGVGDYELPVVIENHQFTILEVSPEVIDSLVAQSGSRMIAGDVPFYYLP